MPIISRFFGIVIYMSWREHAPPHFHAKYQDDEIVIDIETGVVTGTIVASRGAADCRMAAAAFGRVEQRVGTGRTEQSVVPY